MRIVRTYPALASVNLPRSAQILDVQPRPDLSQAPALVVSIDDADAETEQRRFAILDVGATIPLGAQFVASWRRHPTDGGIACLFELAEEVPAAVPAEAHRFYRHLVREGFVWVGNAWTAPEDSGGLGHEAIIALAELAPYGYGECRNA